MSSNERFYVALYLLDGTCLTLLQGDNLWILYFQLSAPSGQKKYILVLEQIDKRWEMWRVSFQNLDENVFKLLFQWNELYRSRCTRLQNLEPANSLGY